MGGRWLLCGMMCVGGGVGYCVGVCVCVGGRWLQCVCVGGEGFNILTVELCSSRTGRLVIGDFEHRDDTSYKKQKLLKLPYAPRTD